MLIWCALFTGPTPIWRSARVVAASRADAAATLSQAALTLNQPVTVDASVLLTPLGEMPSTAEALMSYVDAAGVEHVQPGMPS